MKFKKIMAQFEAENLSLAEEMISELFFSFDIRGVVCDVPIEEPDEGFGTHTLNQPDIFSIIGFLPLTDTCDITLKGIKEAASALSDLDISVTINTEVVDEQDWADAWKSYFHVTPITDRITIKPEWRDYTGKDGEIVIRLDPGMAFGTGTHPTTALCIKLIQEFMTPGLSFLDVGTGSGILLIAAAKLGAAELSGIDTDEVAVAVARENLMKNSIDPSGSTVLCTTLEQTPDDPVDLIAANIIAQVIVDILPQIRQRMKKSSIAILSGIIRDRLEDVLSALESCHLKVIREEYEEEWVALAVRPGEGIR